MTHSKYDCPKCEFILDIYFKGDTTHMWTKKKTGETKHYKLAYHPKIYVSADFTSEEAQTKNDEKQYLTNPIYPRSLRDIAKIVYSHPHVISVKFVRRYKSSQYERTSNMIEVELLSFQHFDEIIKDFKSRRINMYNIDINKRQQFFIDTKSRPMSAVHIITKKRGLIRKYDDSKYYNDYSTPSDTEEIVSIKIHENMSSIDYELPRMDILELNIKIKQNTSFPRLKNSIQSIVIKHSYFYLHKAHPLSCITLEGFEFDIINTLIDKIKVLNPDFLLVPQGDKFMLNYLAYRAKLHYIPLLLGRLYDQPLYPRKNRKGQSYMTYGQIMHRDPVIYIPGRIHLDNHNSFFFYDSGFNGLIELSRISGIPLTRVSRASIGTVLTGVEMLINAMTIPETLLAPSKAKGEKFKSSEHLLISDNGGLIFDAEPGIYTGVWAIDFTSLYPFIMLNHNISSDTVLCEHRECKIPMTICSSDYDDDPNYYSDRKKIAKRCYQYDNIVPEVNYHICTKRIGVITRSMSYILHKRVELKSRKKDNCIPKYKRDRYKHIDSAMKWILVSAFGYLGFKNARWGAIEAHQAVTSYARRYLLQAKLIANEFGYRLIGGITDSLFLQAIDPQNDTRQHMNELISVISERTGIPMDFEGKFQWVVFTNIRNYTNISALNRYFGYFDHNEFKLRGIRHRQRRVTILEKTFQKTILDIFKNSKTLDEFKNLIPQAEKILIQWQTKIRNRIVDSRDLIIKIKSGKGSGNYKFKNTHQAIATSIYKAEGRYIEAGENIFYIVRDNEAKGYRRITIGPKVREKSVYDIAWYCKLLENTFLEILETPQRQFFGKILYDGKPKRHKLEDFNFDSENPYFEWDNIIYKRLLKKRVSKIEKLSLDSFF